MKSLLLKGLLRRRHQWQSKGWELGGTPLSLAGSTARPFPALQVTGLGDSVWCRERMESLPMALSGLGIALSWERMSISLLSGWLLSKGKRPHCPGRLSQSWASAPQRSVAFMECTPDTNLSFGVDRARDVRHSCITGCHRYTWGEGKASIRQQPLVQQELLLLMPASGGGEL